ncbi:MAG: hypothetical protein QXJ97_09835 [Desulfurococcaceae archaeon]
MKSWDKGVDYVSVYNMLKRNLHSRNKKDVCYSAILMIQLRNGSRISEAIECFKQYILTRKTEYYVKVRKKRKEDYRLMVIPEELHSLDLAQCSDLLSVDDRQLRDRVRKYISRKYKINTHSLRYAFITYLLRNNINVSIIARITHHSNLNYILHYTQQRLADEILKNI